jgi:hypoxanthine phosphoribosyltransferase
MIRKFSTMAPRLPLCQIGWSFQDLRTKSGLCVGSALLDGDYRTTWEFYKIAQRSMLVSSLAFLKGGQVPNGLMVPYDTQGKYLLPYICDVISESKKNVNLLNSQTVFNRTYDCIFPLPSSKGPANDPNINAARAIAKSLSPHSGGDAGPPIVNLLDRSVPMKTKSTATCRSIRTNPDAPRIMHFDTLRFSEIADVKGKRILLYDDVVTWGNTSEAVRNLLLLSGAAEVDLITCFSTGPMMRAANYSCAIPGFDAKSNFNADSFKLVSSCAVSKDLLKWTGIQETHKEWHALLGQWIDKRFPELVPNDIIEV